MTAPEYQEHLHFPENHKFLTSPEEVEREFDGHEDLISEFKRRLEMEREKR